MNFDEWWEEIRKQDSGKVTVPLRTVARAAWDAAWEAAKMDTVNELNDSIRKAWPEDEE